jgi:hypothetical protein
MWMRWHKRSSLRCKWVWHRCLSRWGLRRVRRWGWWWEWELRERLKEGVS